MRFAAGILCVLAPALLSLFSKDEPEVFAGPQEHFKYGSIGAEGRAGLPYWIWAALPRLFPEHLPNRPGEGYARFGLIFETPASKRPIGTSYREVQVGLVGLNCAACHTGTLRDSPASPRRIILGMPAHQFDLQSYQRFLFACGADPRFTPEHLLPAIRALNPEFSWFDSLLYRFVVIPRTRRGIAEERQRFAWFDQRPPQGPGRVDTFNPYKVFFGFDLKTDTSIGTADLPSLWNQKMREGLWLHWDGNNDLVTERNKRAAIGAGASEDSLDLAGMKRVEDWIWELPAPAFPSDRVNRARLDAGRQIYEKRCAACHSPGSRGVGQTVELEKIGTDPERLHSFTAGLAKRMNTLGRGRPWKFSHFRKTDGYASMPLVGVWLQAPYLHNGSVPTLRDLLTPPENRPAVFWRGYDVYDYDNVGFVSSGREAERAGFRLDTGVRGNGRQGHAYGTDLKDSEKNDLIEYLKTL